MIADESRFGSIRDQPTPGDTLDLVGLDTDRRLETRPYLFENLPSDRGFVPHRHIVLFAEEADVDQFVGRRVFEKDVVAFLLGFQLTLNELPGGEFDALAIVLRLNL